MFAQDYPRNPISTHILGVLKKESYNHQMFLVESLSGKSSSMKKHTSHSKNQWAVHKTIKNQVKNTPETA